MRRFIFSIFITSLSLSAIHPAVSAPTEIACIPGEQKKVLVSESDATIEFVVRGAAGILEEPSRSCWCGERDEVFKKADRFNGVLTAVQLAKGFPAEATRLKDAVAGGTPALSEEIIRSLGLVRDFEFEVELPPGVAQRSQSASCLSETELADFAQRVHVFLKESTKK